MISIDKKLQSILNLNDTETSIYLAVLPYEHIGANEIANLTGIKRTTVYHATDSLVFQGFMAKKKISGKTVFSTISPQHLQRALLTKKIEIQNQQKQLEELLPELKLIQKGPLFTTNIHHYQGVAGVKAAYEEMLYCKSRHWDQISPTAAFAEQYSTEFHHYVLEKRHERGISTRTLWDTVKKYARLPVALKLKRQLRLMPKDMRGRFKSKIILFDKKVALVTPVTDPGVIIIDSPEIHSVFLTLFDAVWEISKPINIK